MAPKRKPQPKPTSASQSDSETEERTEEHPTKKVARDDYARRADGYSLKKFNVQVFKLLCEKFPFMPVVEKLRPEVDAFEAIFKAKQEKGECAEAQDRGAQLRNAIEQHISTLVMDKECEIYKLLCSDEGVKAGYEALL